MTCKTSFELYHNFPKLAEESGFAFNTHRPRVHIDWSKIRLIDIERLIKDRKFVLIEQHVNDILECVFESEFDVRILDEGVVKLFRLAQLTVEYQQFCRHYLDRSVHVLRGELSTLMEQLDSTKKDVKDKEEELRRLKRKSKHMFRPTFSGNENIANMILKTLSNNGEMFPSSSYGHSSHEYNKCSYCDKVFLNQLYLKSHLARRHSNVTDIPQRDGHDANQDGNKNEENLRLNTEITELKDKLREMEMLIMNANNKTKEENILPDSINIPNPPSNRNDDREIGQENIILEKIEEWKKEEQKKYSREIDNLRSQITDTINNLRLKEKDEINDTRTKENELIIQLHKTIQDQGAELLALKQEIINKKSNVEIDKTKQASQIETNMQIWMKKMQQQAENYEKMISNLTEEAKKANEARVLAEAETTHYKNMAMQTLQADNQESLKRKSFSDAEAEAKKLTTRTKLLTDKKLEELHQKAQELLNLGSTSSSEDFSLPDNVTQTKTSLKNITSIANKLNKVESLPHNHVIDKPSHGQVNTKPIPNTKVKEIKQKQKKSRKVKSQRYANTIKENLPTVSSQQRSPIKIVRAKIMEEVNSKLVNLGVDPLHKELDFDVFNRQRIQLQQEQRIKSQNKPSYERVRNSIVAYLDSKAGTESTFRSDSIQYLSPTKNSAFSLTSMISNVKNKAISLVKNNEHINHKRKLKAIELTKKSSSSLKTPPSSGHTSPTQRRSSLESTTSHNSDKRPTKVDANKINHTKVTRQCSVNVKNISNMSDDTETDTSESESNDKTKNDKLLKSVVNTIKSPVKHPSTTNRNNNAQSVTKLNQPTETDSSLKLDFEEHGIKKVVTSPIKKTMSENNIHYSPIQTRSVLKSAVSTSSLNKKKVLFDLDAIQTKSVSASPSQSTERSEGNEKYELGLVNLDDEEWDISSIENDPLKNNEDLKLNLSSRTTKVSELKQTIESQLARRTVTPSTVLVGIDLLGGSSGKANTGGSNTSLGSSVLDTDDLESDAHKKNVSPTKPKQLKDFGEFDLSDLSVDDQPQKSTRDSF